MDVMSHFRGNHSPFLRIISRLPKSRAKERKLFDPAKKCSEAVPLIHKFVSAAAASGCFFVVSVHYTLVINYP